MLTPMDMRRAKGRGAPAAGAPVGAPADEAEQQPGARPSGLPDMQGPALPEPGQLRRVRAKGPPPSPGAMKNKPEKDADA